jgi:hypothetical protein
MFNLLEEVGQVVVQTLISFVTFVEATTPRWLHDLVPLARLLRKCATQRHASQADHHHEDKICIPSIWWDVEPPWGHILDML